MCAALVSHGVDHTIVRWIRATLEGLLAAATLNGFSVRNGVSRGCPRGGGGIVAASVGCILKATWMTFVF
jgi:hypothetical protein